jgi:glycosyltransferase involved in cell wall biosynthesis
LTLKIAALTSGLYVPSARFRIRQYIVPLRKYGIQVNDYFPAVSQGARIPGVLGQIRLRYMPPIIAAQMLLNLMLRVPGVIGSYRSDMVWLERNFLPGLDSLAKILKGPMILDLDDAIWLYNPMGTKMIGRLVSMADVVLAGNQFIADWCSKHSDSVHIVPTAIDCNRFVPPSGNAINAMRGPDVQFTVGWTGTSGNFPFLYMIEGPLAQFLNAHPDARFLLVADQRPRFSKLPGRQIVFRPWMPEIENTIMHEMDVGIMPLRDDDLAKGKCSFKMLQYMAVKLPVIGSPVGMNLEVFSRGDFGIAARNETDWLDALECLYRDAKRRATLGENGREIVLAHYSLEKSTPVLAGIFRHLSG